MNSEPRIDPRILLCMHYSTLFTPEMVARYGGSAPDHRRKLDDLVCRGVLARLRGRTLGSVEFYYKKSRTEPPLDKKN